ncbi:MAG: hypothetical protein VX633_03945 [Verrucomicrobiota bacterium]|nr:hypothetical protein [Verrucomicrobiota bacterium]
MLPTSKKTVAMHNPGGAKRLATRLAQVDSERPPLGDKPLLMDPPLPYIYGIKENANPPEWLVDHVDAIRARQPKKWAPGETPWPQAPIGVNANKQPGSK